jgi:protein ImuA
MNAVKTDMIARLKMDILPLEGLKVIRTGEESDFGLEILNAAFPHGNFPLGAMHEFICMDQESVAATTGFISGLVGSLMKKNGAVVWISSSRKVFPPALRQFGIHPERIVFIDLQKEQDILWAMEEALKCRGLAAVVGEINDLSFTSTRRFQLAVEQSRVTGFILRPNPRHLQTNACVSQWKIKSIPSESCDGLPGLGFPRWKVELLKIRNGKPGIWQIEWSADRFRPVFETLPSLVMEPERKTG